MKNIPSTHTHASYFQCYPDRPGEYFKILDPKNDSGNFAFAVLHMFPLPLGRWTSLESCHIPAGQTEYTIKPYNISTIGWYEKMAVTVNVVLILLILWGIFRGIWWMVRPFLAGVRANARNHSDTL